MTYLQGECSVRHAEQEEEDGKRFNLGRVLVLNSPPATAAAADASAAEVGLCGWGCVASNLPPTLPPPTLPPPLPPPPQSNLPTGLPTGLVIRCSSDPPTSPPPRASGRARCNAANPPPAPSSHGLPRFLPGVVNPPPPPPEPPNAPAEPPIDAPAVPPASTIPNGEGEGGTWNDPATPPRASNNGLDTRGLPGFSDPVRQTAKPPPLPPPLLPLPPPPKPLMPLPKALPPLPLLPRIGGGGVMPPGVAALTGWPGARHEVGPGVLCLLSHRLTLSSRHEG